MRAPIRSCMHIVDVIRHTLLPSSTASLIRSSLRLFDYLFVRLFVLSSIQSFIHPFIHPCSLQCVNQSCSCAAQRSYQPTDKFSGA